MTRLTARDSTGMPTLSADLNKMYVHDANRAVVERLAYLEDVFEHKRLIDADALIARYNLDKVKKYGNDTPERRDFSYSTMMMYEIADMINDAVIATEAALAAGKAGAQ